MNKAVALVKKCLENQELVLDPGNCGWRDEDFSSGRELGCLLVFIVKKKGDRRSCGSGYCEGENVSY